jgi:hypothetical protein
MRIVYDGSVELRIVIKNNPISDGVIGCLGVM